MNSKRLRPDNRSGFEYDLRCPKIDVHWHVGSWNLNEARLSVREMRQDFDRFGYRYVLVNSIKAIVYDMEAGNAETARLLKEDERCRGLVVINPVRQDASLKEIRKYLGHPGFVGLKSAADYYSTTIADIRYEKILSMAEKGAWPILTHKYGMELIVEKYKNVKFILAHSLFSDAKKMAGFSNVYFDIAASYAYRDETNIEGMLELAGPKRVLFGTDAQIMSPAWSIGKISSARISQSDKNKIFHDNAFELFGRFKSNCFGG
ncbi:MAG: amidohydrolase family protein [Candidatus Omnitrophica bacterium]|nr:amidohydrolase family protein [Candidatus Omnitrophota bacterium]